MSGAEPEPWSWDEAACLTDRGQRYLVDQGRALVSRRAGLAAVAHGMGGSGSASVLGAEAVVDTLGDWVAGGGSPDWPVDGDPQAHPVVAALRQASARLLALPARDRRYTGVAAVVAALVSGPGRVLVAHAGDCRVYRLRDDRLEALTVDHSLREAQRRGHPGVTVEMVERFPSIVTRGLGLSAEVDPEARWLERRPGDLFLLCSYGLTEVLSEDAIAGVLAWRGQPPREACDPAGPFTSPALAETCEQLVAHANRAGAPHNVAVALVRG